MHLEQKARRVRNGGKEPGHVQGFSVTDFEVFLTPSFLGQRQGHRPWDISQKQPAGRQASDFLSTQL